MAARSRFFATSQVPVILPGAACGRDGPLAAGSCQAVDGIAQITGVGVLPSSRRQGLGAAVTALLAGDALDRGVDTVFLSASDDAVARIYARIGFRAIGTAMIADSGPWNSQPSRLGGSSASSYASHCCPGARFAHLDPFRA